MPLHSGGVVAVTLARPIQLDTLALESGLVALANILLEDAQPYVEAIDTKLRVINCCTWERCPRIIFGLVAKVFPWGCSSASSTLYRPGNAEWACCDRLLLAKPRSEEWKEALSKADCNKRGVAVIFIYDAQVEAYFEYGLFCRGVYVRGRRSTTKFQYPDVQYRLIFIVVQRCLGASLLFSVRRVSKCQISKDILECTYCRKK